MEITINKKTFDFKEVIEDLNKIHLIITDNCKYCKEKNINKDKDKIELINRIIKKYFG